MSKTRILLAAVCLLLFLSAGLAFPLRSRLQVPPRAAFVAEIERPGNELIAGYRQWTKVNPYPALVSARAAILCASAIATAGPNDPHGPSNPRVSEENYITVYVNDTGRRAMMEEKTPHFPQGSVIVKEKLPNEKSTTPELLTVMIKRESGYNPESGDWEYMVVDGSGKTVQARGKLDNCQGCHVSHADTDYISRAYLPFDVRDKLK